MQYRAVSTIQHRNGSYQLTLGSLLFGVLYRGMGRLGRAASVCSFLAESGETAEDRGNCTPKHLRNPHVFTPLLA
jgi:hypothetical protein